MMPHYRYAIPDTLSNEDLVSALHSRLGCEVSASRQLKQTYYDSFDWRLYAEGLTLSQQVVHGVERLVLHTGVAGPEAVVSDCEHMPRFSWELPPGPLQKRLTPLLEMRALLPRFRLTSHIQPLQLSNKQGKTVAQLVLEDHRAQAKEKAKSQPLPRTLRLMPVKGYSAALKRCVDFLEQQLKLTPIHEDLLQQILQCLHQPPAEDPSRFAIRLDPAWPAEFAVRLILSRLLVIMENNEAGVIEDLDTEFLHDLRVAVRRTRSALQQIKGVFPPAQVKTFREDFRWLGSITTPTRDLDAHLLNFEEYSARLPASQHPELEPLRGFLLRHRKTELSRLKKTLRSARYRNLKRRWHSFLETVPNDPDCPRATQAVHQLARRCLWRSYRRTLSAGRAIDDKAPAERLHEVRKDCKKLRYLMEFFQSLYPPGTMQTLIQELKRLQNNLGEFQDLEVHIHALKSIAEQMHMEGEPPLSTLQAMHSLGESLEEEKRRVRQAFAQRFDKFDTKKNHARFKALRKPLTSLQAQPG